MNAKYAIAAARKIGASVFIIWEDITEVKPKIILTFVGAIIAEGHRVTDE
jgi:plastin-1